MSSLNTNINDYTSGSVHGPSYIPEETKKASSKGTDSGLSSIEKSLAVASMMTPPMDIPFLVAPSSNSQQQDFVFTVAAMDSSGKPFVQLLLSQQGQIDQIKQDILDSWSKSIREMDEMVKQMLNSPVYQAILAIRLHGDAHQGNVTGVQATTSANAAAANPTTANAAPYSFMNAIDRARSIDHVSRNVEVSEGSPGGDAARSVVIPMMGVFIAGGALALGVSEITVSATGVSSTPLTSAVELVESLQPVFPQIAMQDIIPMINLMVMAPIYFNSWNEATSRLKGGERESQVETAQNFAKDAIKMVSNPGFVMVNFVNKMPGTERMSPDNKEQMAVLLKLILSSVALSLLYSTEVGTAQGDAYGGMEPQEFRDLLNGTIILPADKQSTLQGQLMGTLIKLVNAQLDAMPDAARRAQAVEVVVDYIANSHSVKNMLDPVKVFDQVLSSNQFDNQAASLDTQPA